MKPIITVIDYGVGNIFSVSRAFEHCGARVNLTSIPNEIATAEHVVLPGVGAFADGMAALRERGLIAPIRQFARTGRPFLGVCLGMQMLFDTSEEFGTHEGLGLIHGKVMAIPTSARDGRPHKVPHIGWNELVPPPNRDWTGSILDHLPVDASAYFVHSFQAIPDNPDERLADCNYNGMTICAAVQSGSINGCQFHPEKSAAVGLQCIENFIKLEGDQYNNV
jgi:glutamine amidotransferase